MRPTGTWALRSPPMYAIGGGGFNPGRFRSTRPPGLVPPAPPPGFPGDPTGEHMVPHAPMAPPMIAPAYHAPPAPYPSAFNITGNVNANIQQQSYSNVTKHYSNWNACYSCGLDIPESHTSMTCPMHLHRPTHDVNFTCRNAQQYINMGHPCSTKNQHKIRLSSTM
jgi:hypothetical protein